MAGKEKRRDFSCDNCGHKITAYPPDDAHNQFSIKRCCEKSIERSYECDNCDYGNIRYWCFFHLAIGAANGPDIDSFFRSRSL